MKVDGFLVSPNIINGTDLDAYIDYNPGTLVDGVHTVYINVTDNAGRYSETSWEFEISQETFELNVYSPLNGTIYNIRGIPMNISLNKEVKKLEYIDYSSSRKIWRTLCRNCDEYGFSRKRTKSFSDGEHNISIRATDEFENSEEKNISFTVDRTKPRIYKTEPRRGFTNGSFYIKFKEENPVNLTLYYNDSYKVNISNECVYDGKRYYECDVNVDLISHNGDEIEYYFYLEDIAGNNYTSRATKVEVDTTPPVINNPTFYTNDSRYIYFDINITEENLDKVILQYDYRGKTRERRLCSRLKEGICEKRFRFKEDYTNLKLIITDKAGNFKEEVVLI